PAGPGSDSSTFVYPLGPAGQTASAFGLSGFGVVADGVDGEPGAAGRGPFVIVGCGAFGSVLVDTTGALPVVAPGPSGTAVVAVAGCADPSRVEFATSTAAVATTVSTRKSATG